MIGIWFKLKNDGFACIDKELYTEIMMYNWSITKHGYVRRRIGGQIEYLHQFVFFKVEKEYINDLDHKNRDKLDCRRENLRVATRSQNMANCPKKGKNKYRGVTSTKAGKYMVKIRINGVQTYLGTFESEVDAAHKYNNVALQQWGDFALLNEV